MGVRVNAWVNVWVGKWVFIFFLGYLKIKIYLCSHRTIKHSKRMGSIFIIQGILIYIYAFDHNPPHIHVRSGTDNFSITIQDRIIEGKARSKTIKIINDFIDEHEEELMELWGKAQRGEKITKIR